MWKLFIFLSLTGSWYTDVYGMHKEIASPGSMKSISLVSKQDTVMPVVIIVRKDGVVGKDCDFSGNRAIQDAIENIRDAGPDKPYLIKVYPGEYAALEVAAFNSKESGPGNYAFIRGKDYVSLQGTDREQVIIRGELPDNLGATFSYESYQTMYWHAHNSSIKNLTITAHNLRYPVHIDGGATGLSDVYTSFKEVTLIHYGNEGDAARWKSWHPLGLGLSQGQVIVAEECIFQSPSWPLYMHTNSNFNKASKLIFRNCRFNGTGEHRLLACLQSLGSHQQDEVRLENCTWDDGYIMQANDVPYLSYKREDQHYNHCDLKITGHGNSPFLWLPAFRGEVLKITSKASDGGTVSIDTTSSAFALIMGNNENSHRYSTTVSGEVQSGGYVRRKGKGVIKAYARGCVDVGEESTVKNTYIKSLGKRLGNCTVTPKTLRMIVNGKKYEVVFNQDYIGEGIKSDSIPAAYSNQQIIAAIQAVIGEVAEVSLWIAGNDYFPEFTDYVTRAVAKEPIQKGMAVVYDPAGKLRRATGIEHKIGGIALDDMLPGEKGRVLKKGYIAAGTAACFQALVEKELVVKKGERLGIGTTPGILSRSATGKPFYAIDDNVLAFNLQPR